MVQYSPADTDVMTSATVKTLFKHSSADLTPGTQGVTPFTLGQSYFSIASKLRWATGTPIRKTSRLHLHSTKEFNRTLLNRAEVLFAYHPRIISDQVHLTKSSFVQAKPSPRSIGLVSPKGPRILSQVLTKHLSWSNHYYININKCCTNHLLCFIKYEISL